MRSRQRDNAGFTLVEMIIVIVITGIVAGMVAVFMRAPVQGYVDSARRAELTDVADTALRRISRDVRTAVPNSVRLTNCPAGSLCVEFLPTKEGGRYRAIGPGNTLDFGAPDGSFDIVGPPIVFAANDYIVVGSTQSTGATAYSTAAAGVLRAYAGAAGAQTTVTITNPNGLPVLAELPSRRFDVVDGAQRAVAYACTQGTDAEGDGTGVLTRYWNYGFNVVPSVNSAVLANNVSFCNFAYDVNNQRLGLLAVQLTLSRAGESVNVYGEIHVNNQP
jgi:MSHA biogenesis protein MshO